MGTSFADGPLRRQCRRFQHRVPQALLSNLAHADIDLEQPFTLFWVSSIISNIVGNNPAMIMLVPYLHSNGHAQYGAALSLGTHFSSNGVRQPFRHHNGRAGQGLWLHHFL